MLRCFSPSGKTASSGVETKTVAVRGFDFNRAMFAGLGRTRRRREAAGANCRRRNTYYVCALPGSRRMALTLSACRSVDAAQGNSTITAKEE